MGSCGKKMATRACQTATSEYEQSTQGYLAISRPPQRVHLGSLDPRADLASLAPSSHGEWIRREAVERSA